MTKASNNDGAGSLKNKLTLLTGLRCYLMTTLLQAACHGHRDIVYDILRQTRDAAVDAGMYDVVNSADSQV